MRKINEIFNPSDLQFQIEESKDKNNHILANLKGEFFFPNGKSRNGRFYPQRLWDKVLTNEDIKIKLNNKTMFGTVGHGIDITDETLGEGKVSHFMTKLYIDQNGRGMGEAQILDTPAGRILNTFLRAGSRLCTSSRADGEYANETYDGLEVIDVDSYQLYGFDFVMDPGFEKAFPSISESLKKDLDYVLNRNVENINKGENNMSLEKVLEDVTKEKGKLEADLNKALDENKKALREIGQLQSDSAKITSEFNVLKEKVENLEKEKTEISGKFDSAYKDLEAYKAIGAAEEIKTNIDKAVEELKVYKEIGTAEEINSVSEKAVKELGDYKKLGTVKEIDTAAEKAIKVIEAYKSLGTIDELSKMVNCSDKLVTKLIEEEELANAEALSVELEIPMEKIQMFLDKGMAIEDVKDLIKSLLGDEDITDDVTDDEDMEDASVLDKYSDEDEDETPLEAKNKKKKVERKIEKGSSTSRLMESFCGIRKK